MALQPVRVYNTGGHYIQDIGPAAAVAGFPDATGHYFSVVPNSSFTSSIVTEFSSSMSPIGSFSLQFSIGPSGGALQVRRNFYTFNSFPWTPADSEGVYDVQVMVHSSTVGTGIGSAVYDVTSRVPSGSSPVVSRTLHPL